MKKIACTLLVALFAATPLFLTGCSSSDGDDDNGGGSGSATSTAVLKINGTDTYSCTSLMNVVTVNGSFLNTQSVTTHDDIIDFDSNTYSTYSMDNFDGTFMTDAYAGGVRFQVATFDYKTAAKGTVLTPKGDITHLIYVERKNGKAIEHCYANIISGTITFESYSANLYDEEVITLRFNNVVGNLAHSYGDNNTAPQTMTFDGLVLFKKTGN